MNHQVDHSNEYHCFTTLCQCLVVLRQAAVLTQPGEGSFDNPSLWQHHKPMQCRTLDDFNEAPGPTARPVNKPAGIAAVGENQLQASKTRSQLVEQQLAAVAILDAGRMDNQRYDQANGVDDQMTLTAKDFLARIVPTIPPFSAVFTDWLSMMPTLGVGLRPSFRRTWPRSRSWISCHVPLSRKQR